jgi:AraC-like DNA-binding protein
LPIVYLGSRLINGYNKKIKEYYSSVEGKTLNWIRELLWVLLITGIFSALVNIIGKSYFVNYPLLLMIPSLIFSIMLFMIGLLGYKQNYTVQNYQTELMKFDDPRNNFLEDSNQNINPIDNRKKLKCEFVNLLEEKELFKKSDLRITDVSILLNSNRSYVSSMVNSDFNCSFSDLINRYRVEYAKKILVDPKMYILDYVADGSGFASVNSLLRAFRKETGMTPGEFRKINK